MTTKVQRHVKFLPFCEVREFGDVDLNATHNNPSTIESMKYAAEWLQNFPENPLPAFNWDHVKSKEFDYQPKKGLKRYPNMPIRKPPPMKVLAMVSKNKADPMRNTIIKLLTNKKKRDMEFEVIDAQKQKLRETHGVIWTRPTALSDVRENWHHSDEMESNDENPADTEVDVETPRAARPKKLMTRKQRYQRQVAKRKADWTRKADTLKMMYFKKSLRNFIEKTKMGVQLRSICSKDDEVIENDGFKSFAEMRTIFATNNHRGTRKIDFRVRAHIFHRLANPNLDPKLRIAYEVVLDNYDSILGPHLYYVFQTKDKKSFRALEKVFMLNY